MPRWQQDPRGRLLRSAMDLFAEQGYEATTAVQIAERAGLTKTTLFRHFTDKREILFQGQAASVAAATRGIDEAADATTPFELMRAAVLAMCAEHTSEHRDTGRRLEPLVSRSIELQERANFKRSSITQAIERALDRRVRDARLAGVLADLGVRAYYEGFDAWVSSTAPESLTDVVDRELAGYRAVIYSV